MTNDDKLTLQEYFCKFDFFFDPNGRKMDIQEMIDLDSNVTFKFALEENVIGNATLYNNVIEPLDWLTTAGDAFILNVYKNFDLRFKDELEDVFNYDYTFAYFPVNEMELVKIIKRITIKRKVK